MKMRQKAGYAAGDFGISVAYFIVGFFFMYYLTDIVRLPPFLAGLTVFLGKLWEGVCNPLVGVLNDRITSRYGKKRAFILFGAVPFALSFILLWLIPPAAGEALKFTLAVLFSLLYATAYSIISVPYMALVPAMTRDYDERTQIMSLRAVLSTVGIVLGGAAALMVSSFTDEPMGLKAMAVFFGTITAVTLLIAARNVKGVEASDGRGSRIIQASLSRYLSLLRERYVFVLLLFKFLGAVATGSLMAAIPYFAKHILADTGNSTYGVAIYTVTSAALIPVWYKLTRRYDKRRLLLIANCLGAAVLLATSLLVNSGDTAIFFLGCGLLGIIMSSYLLIPYSLVPDLVDYYGHKTGIRHESVYFGLWMTTHQLGIAVSGFILGSFLGAFGYDGNAETQTEPALWAVRLAFGLIPGLFLVICALVLQKYGITRKVYQEACEEKGGQATAAPGKHSQAGS
jgi:GPH family glycoside/pentoside/hexuronide:cation symporter